MKAMTNGDLLRMFRRLNKEWFNNQVPEPTVIRFRNLNSDGDDGHINGETLEIHKDFSQHPNHCQVVMLHEMAHGMIPECQVVHGLRWCAIIDRLYHAGAYDGLL
jgi:hypothetical protein